MRFTTQNEYDNFIRHIASQAILELSGENLVNFRDHDAIDGTYEFIANAAEEAIVDRVSAGQVIQFFRGDEADLVLSNEVRGKIYATAIAMIDCDARDILRAGSR